MWIVGRKEEKELLEDCINSNYPEFLVVYGRRRIGKTYLIKEFFNNRFSFYTTGVANINKKEQLRIFHQSLRDYGSDDKTVPKDWFEAFLQLKKLLSSDVIEKDFGSQKKIVFLDEAPWLDTQKSDFKSALEYFWNSWGSSQNDLLLIICGSATSWIVDNVFNNTGGLYNRVTKRMHLSPFTLKECEEFFQRQNFMMTRSQILECYMIFGGVPYYLRLLSQRYGFHQDVERLLFTHGGALTNEFDFLYTSLFKNSEIYIKVIKMLAEKKSGLSREEIVSYTGIESGGQLTKILKELEECDFIRKYRDFTKAKSGYLYQLVDSFTLFYLTFFENEKIDSWLSYIYSPGYYAWSGFAFERVCLMHIRQIKEALKIAGIQTSEFSWKSKNAKPGAQIDLLIDRKDRIIDICEMKYTGKPFAITTAYSKELIRKRETFREETKTDKALHIIMVAANGLSKSPDNEIITNLLTQDDLFI